MRGGTGYWVTLAGLAALSIVTPWWLRSSFAAVGIPLAIALGALPLLGLLYACVRRTRNWSGITALVMIPLAVIGLMEVIATAGAVGPGIAIAVLAVAVFFAVLDAGRRNPTRD